MTSTRAQVLRTLRIDADDFVVEVGGGHDPFWRSNVIFDKYPFDNLHRADDLVHRAPVMIADANCLPLPDRGCDLLFASHIIEHLPTPDRFLGEVQRCARFVYLEFPARHRELLFGWSMHEWLVEVRDTHLTFYRNDLPQFFGEFFHSNYDFLLDAWMLRRHADLNRHAYCESAALTWEIAREGAFEHVTGSSPRGKARVNRAASVEVEYSWRQLGVLVLQKLLAKALLDRAVQAWRRRRRGAARVVTQALLDRLACPACRTGALTLAGDVVHCRSCGAEYRRRNGLFDLDVVGEEAGRLGLPSTPTGTA